MDETGLLHRARSGEPEAIDGLLNESRPLVEGYLRKRARSREDAEDLLQETMVQAARSLPNFRGDCPFRHWMLRIAARKLSTYYQRSAPPSALFSSINEHFEDFAPEPLRSDPIPSLHEQVDEQRFAAQLLQAAEQACNAEEFRILMLVYQGESFEEIGALLDIKAEVVRVYFHRARGKLMAHLYEYQPNLLGGSAAIQAALERLSASGSPQDRLKPDEAAALQNPSKRKESLRSACLKLVRFLPIPFAVWLLIMEIFNR